MGSLQIGAAPAVLLQHNIGNSPSVVSTISARVQHVYTTTSSFFSGVGNAFKRNISKLVMPSALYSHSAAQMRHDMMTAYTNAVLPLRGHLRGEVKTLNSRPGVQLEGIHWRYEDHGRTSDRHLIYFLPNGGLIGDLSAHLQQLAERAQANLTCYNYRGTGLSTGTLHDENDLLEDGRAIVNSVLEHPETARELVLHGYSMGGGVATQLASRILQKSHCAFGKRANRIHHFQMLRRISFELSEE